MLALLAAAAVLLPRSADVVLSIEDGSGLRALLEKAGGYAPSLSPRSIGALLRDRSGVDLLAEPGSWGLAPRGARLLVFSRNAIGLAAPVRNRKAARRMLRAWLADDRRRLGKISGSTLLTASGPGARALLAGMSRPVPLAPALRPRARGPLWLWARLEAPLQATVLAIDAGAAGLVARGVVSAAGPLLDGAAPAGCAGGSACLRAGVTDAGRRVIALALERAGAPRQAGLLQASRVEERVDAIETKQLAGDRSLFDALRLSSVFDGAESSGAALDARIDLAQVDGALAGMTPLDALRGSLAAFAYAAHVLYGQLLRNAGPLTATGRPARSGETELELRLPLR